MDAKTIRADIRIAYRGAEEAAFLAAINAASDEQLVNLWDAPIVVKQGVAPNGLGCKIVIRAIEWSDKSWAGRLGVYAIAPDGKEQQIKRSDLAKVLAMVK